MEEKIDYRAFLSECAVNGANCKYLTETRGLTEDTIKRFNLGYCTKEIYEKYKDACKLPKLIGYITIPYNQELSYFIARNTQRGTGKKYKFYKPKTDNAGEEPLFNADEVNGDTTEPLFICEAQLDALSIEQAGGKAIAFGGGGNGKLLQAIDDTPDHFKKRVNIIATDTDESGEEYSTKISDKFKQHDLPYVRFKFPQGIKDANEYLIYNKDEFYTTVKKLKVDADAIAETVQEETLQKLNQFSYFSALTGFFDRVKNSPPAISTGFNNIDKAIGGGLYPGLYIIGAISSLGKSTFTLQIADQIAKKGNDVIIFSVEMSTNNLIAKSISRESFLYCDENDIDKINAKTTIELLSPISYTKYNNTDKEIVNESYKRVKAFSKNIFVYEGREKADVKNVTDIIHKTVSARNKSPIVIIDYLQITPHIDSKATDKQNIDSYVLALKGLCNRYNIPIIAISSLNRENYNNRVSMKAFKESGAIEYSSDVLIALQPNGMTDSDAENRKAIRNFKNSPERAVELCVLKNRNGATHDGGGDSIVFNVFAKYNYFKEVSKEEAFIQTHEDTQFNIVGSK